MAQQILPTNTFTTAKWIVSPTASDGTHTTIASALTSASSGDTIFIRPGTYTENPTLKAGVNLTAFGSDGSLNGIGNVIINGTCTLTTAGTVTISGIQLQTNSAALLAVTGSAASIVNLQNCYLNCSNNSGITFSSSSSSAQININNCFGNLGTTGINLFSHSGAGQLLFYYSRFTNLGGSTTASTASAGALISVWSNFSSPVTTSSTNAMSMYQTIIDSTAQNVTPLTVGGSGTQGIALSQFYAGTASAISISSTANVFSTFVSSTNTHAITGGGSLNYSNISFANGGSVLINVTTQNGGVAMGGVFQAPSAGFIGEQIRALNGTGTSLSSGVAGSITSINLTAGVWDVSCVSEAILTGATAGYTFGISTSPTGINLAQFDAYLDIFIAGTGLRLSGAIPTYRAVLTATTTYYLVGSPGFSTGVCTAYGRISATRVG
jgi:hypothetical protein